MAVKTPGPLPGELQAVNHKIGLMQGITQKIRPGVQLGRRPKPPPRPALASSPNKAPVDNPARNASAEGQRRAAPLRLSAFSSSGQPDPARQHPAGADPRRGGGSGAAQKNQHSAPSTAALIRCSASRSLLAVDMGTAESAHRQKSALCGRPDGLPSGQGPRGMLLALGGLSANSDRLAVPEDGSARWSTRTMAARHGVGKGTVWRIWNERGHVAFHCSTSVIQAS